ncbi:MAG TPA: NAD(P)-dependent oxidoreductase [Pyrinomonadaceae bacterium]|nr:NAD(P)-dependent oxidoreductase [Pyrinomonadaceae bacterium]
MVFRGEITTETQRTQRLHRESLRTIEDAIRLNVWITGCSGFLGTRLAMHLVAEHIPVTSLSRRKSSAATRSVEIDLAQRDAPRQIEKLATETAPDIVIHAASKQPTGGELADFVDANVHSSSNLIEGLTQKPPRLIIYTSTHSVYGKQSILPVDESCPAGGYLPYGATKRWGEQMLETFQRYSKIVVLRLPSLYGAGQEDSFIDGLARLAQRDEPIELFSRGLLIRDALHVSDVVKAIDNCIARPPSAAFSIMNLGCGQSIKTIEWANALLSVLPSDSEIVPVDREAKYFDLYADITVAQERIGFAPTSLADSMKVYADELSTRS